MYAMILMAKDKNGVVDVTYCWKRTGRSHADLHVAADGLPKINAGVKVEI